MKTLKKLAAFVVYLLLVVSFSSCEKQSNDLQSISFNIQNVTNSLKKGTPKDGKVPVCNSDKDPAYVIVTLDSKDYRLDILTSLEEGTETKTLKLLAGTYKLNEFKVYADDGTELWAAPIVGSYYAELFGIDGVGCETVDNIEVCRTITIDAFEKQKEEVKVLCWNDFDYKDFGFNWFDYTKVEIKTLCFFGDVCVEDEDQADVWHFTGSSYEGLPYEGSQFVALIEVFIKNSVGEVINDETLNSSLASRVFNDDGSVETVEPVCVEFPDYLNQVDNYTFTVNLIMTDGESVSIVEDVPFNAEDDWSVISGFDKGVYMLEVGCDGNDIPQGDPPPGCVGGGGGFVYYGDVGDICNQTGLSGVGFTADELVLFGSSLEELDNNINHDDPIRGHKFVRFDGWFGRVANPQGNPTQWGDGKSWTYPIFIHNPLIPTSDNNYNFNCLDQKILVGWATYSYLPNESSTGTMNITYEAVDGYVLSNVCTYVNHTNISSKKYEDITCSSGPEGTDIEELSVTVEIPSPRRPAEYLVAGYMNVCPE
ncbi:MAG: hypothetical protein KAH32_06410 [Chlamydiia bacterium]|nr:hypothetical protein [Chlamydiia bacterium]